MVNWPTKKELKAQSNGARISFASDKKLHSVKLTKQTCETDVPYIVHWEVGDGWRGSGIGGKETFTREQNRAKHATNWRGHRGGGGWVSETFKETAAE
jgi:hypothetical protein